MRLDQAHYAALDFESAGSAPGHTDAPVQLAIIPMDGWSIQPHRALRTYLQPGRPVSWKARQLHGISDSHLTHAPALPELWPPIQSLLRHRILIAHSASTEKRFLRAFPTHGFGPWLDTLTLARQLHPRLPSHRLGHLITHFELQPELDILCPGLAWHDALYDAAASLVLFRHLIQSAGWDHLDPHTLLHP